MKLKTIKALQDFIEEVTVAISRQANGKDVYWKDIQNKGNIASDALADECEED